MNRYHARRALAALLLSAVPAALCAAAAPERLVHRYLAVRLSPDASSVASIEGDSPPGGFLPDVRELVIRRLADKSAAHVALPCGKAPQCWPGSIAWRPDGKVLAFTLRTPGSHAYGLYTVGADGMRLAKVLDFSGTLRDLRYNKDAALALLAVASARKEVGATEAGVAVAGDLDAAPAEQRVAVVEGASLRWASPADLFVYEYDWRPDGSGFVGTAAPGDGDNNWWKAKLYSFSRADAGAQVLYAPDSARQQLADPRVSPDGRRVAFIGGIMSDFGSTGGDVFTVPAGGGAATNITPQIKASATALAWSCTGTLQTLLLTGDQHQIVDLGTGAAPGAAKLLWSATDSIGGAEAIRPSACPAGVLASAHESFTSPPEIEAGSIGHWRNITSLNAGLTTAMKVTSLSWANEGFTVQGWLMLPAQLTGRIPMVTIVHGGPAAAATPGFSGPGVITALLAHGWAVFRPNPRGSFGQGERFASANVRDLGYGDLRDILTGIDAAERAAPIDDTRLAVMGGSYGGFMTMFGITQTQRFKAAVASAGISDWESYYGENGIDGWLLPYFGASVYDDPAIYARSSAINFIHNAHTPTFAYVGERDIECPASQTVEFWHAMKAVGVPTSIMIYPGEGHALREPANTQDSTQRTLAWLEKYLK